LAACRIFSRKGVESATMAEIAAEAGLSPGAIYRYFESNDVLARGCLDANALEIEEEWKNVPHDVSDAMGDFEAGRPATVAVITVNGQKARVTVQKEK
jgi:AcrR family transcriptional regulator